MRAHPLGTGNNFQSPLSKLLQPGAARWPAERVEAGSPYSARSKRQPYLGQRRLLAFSITALGRPSVGLVCFILLWSFGDLSWKHRCVLFLSLVFIGNSVQSVFFRGVTHSYG